MARTRSMTSINSQIVKLEEELSRLQAKQEAVTQKLLKLQKEKQEHETKQVMEAYRKSGKSLDELMTFLNV